VSGRNIGLVIVLAILLDVALSGAARGAIICADRATFVDKLASGYDEKPSKMGIDTNGSVVEVFVSDSGTFSIVVTAANGASCLVASGDGWQDAPEEKGLKI
jgi:hypothetical protein